MKHSISLDTNDKIKNFISESLRGQGYNCLESQEVLDFVNNPKTIISFDGYNERVKEIGLGQETIPKQGTIGVINNEFWEFQDPSKRRLFPELSDSPNLFEFLIISIDQVKFNKKTEKIEITEGRYKFSIENKDEWWASA